MKKILIKDAANFITYISKYINESYINEEDLYEKNLLKYYLKFGNCKEISKEIGIGYRTVTNDIKKIKSKLIQKYNEENSNKN